MLQVLTCTVLALLPQRCFEFPLMTLSLAPCLGETFVSSVRVTVWTYLVSSFGGSL